MAAGEAAAKNNNAAKISSCFIVALGIISQINNKIINQNNSATSRLGIAWRKNIIKQISRENIK